MMMVLPTLIVLWAVIVALLTVPAFWKGEQPDPETWANGLTTQPTERNER